MASFWPPISPNFDTPCELSTDIYIHTHINWFTADTQMVSIHVYVGRRFYAVLFWLYTELVLMFQRVFRTFCTGMVLFSSGGMSVF